MVHRRSRAQGGQITAVTVLVVAILDVDDAGVFAKQRRWNGSARAIPC